MTELTANACSLLDILAGAALRGERCPTNLEMVKRGAQYPQKYLRELINQGHIEVRFYGQNFRVIVILGGTYKGQHTRVAPKGWDEQPKSKRARGVEEWWK